MSIVNKFESNEFRVKKYIDVNSNYRDRTTYPLTSNFVITFTTNGQRGSPTDARDPIIAGVPYATGAIAGADNNAFNQAYLNMSGTSMLNNFYIGQVLQVGNEFSVINGYTGLLHSATTSTNFSSVPATGSLYQLRGAQPIFKGTGSTPDGKTYFNLSAGALTSNGVYNNTYMRITSGSLINQIRLITAYTGSSRTAFFQSAFNGTLTNGDSVEILEFTRDNVVPLIYSGSDIFGQPVCYKMRLISLTIPNLTLDVGYGGTIANYSYLYVKFYIEGESAAHQALYSNNPSSASVAFRVPITASDYVLANEFINLHGTAETQTLKFKPNASLHFTVTLPTGQALSFTTKDQFSPLAPNPLVQISALIEIERCD